MYKFNTYETNEDEEPIARLLSSCEDVGFPKVEDFWGGAALECNRIYEFSHGMRAYCL